ncbi:hypothetical protein JCM11251_005500 [Rhodosporidiobolus azoricus]
MAEDVLTMTVDQHVATLLLGPSQAGYQVQLMVFAVFLTLFCGYWASGELRSHQRWGQAALSSDFTPPAVNQDRSFAKMAASNLSWQVLPALGGVIGALTETFLAARAGLLLPNRTLRILFWLWIGLLVLSSLIGCAFVSCVGILFYKGQASPIPWNTGFWMWLWASAVCDVSISLACAYGLRLKIAGFNKVTDSLLRELMVIAFRTASYTSLLSLVGAILCTIWHDFELNSFIPNAFWIPTPAFYGISLFTFSAGSRRAIDARFRDNAHVTQNRLATPQTGAHRSRNSSVPTSALQIEVHHSSEVAFDDSRDLDMEEVKKMNQRNLGDSAV